MFAAVMALKAYSTFQDFYQLLSLGQRSILPTPVHTMMRAAVTVRDSVDVGEVWTREWKTHRLGTDGLVRRRL